LTRFKQKFLLSEIRRFASTMRKDTDAPNLRHIDVDRINWN